jgi:hypothetical protein
MLFFRLILLVNSADIEYSFVCNLIIVKEVCFL